MKKKPFELTEALKNKIISAAYGDASLFDRIKVWTALSKNPEAKKLFLQYKETADQVKQIGEEEFPLDLLKIVESKTILITKDEHTFRWDLLSVIFARPAISAFASIIIVAAIVTSLIINKPVERNYNYSAQEISEAEKQAEYALNLVGKIFNETGSTLQKEILSVSVAKPFNQSFGIVNNLLDGGTNETY